MDRRITVPLRAGAASADNPFVPTPHDDHHPVLEVRTLTVNVQTAPSSLFAKRRTRAIVNDVSFAVSRGETLAVVGESGSGKSTIARAIIGAMPISSGSILFRGIELHTTASRIARELRAKMQMIFQDPYSSMNPRHTIEEIVTEPLIVHRRRMSREERRHAAGELLAKCGMPTDTLDRYPHQFSGGQRQRIAIARALTLSPDLIICDEPTSALDVSVRSQIINLLMELRRERGVSYLFISHDMATVRHIADHVLVLKAGRVIEHGNCEHVFNEPQSEYTRALIDAVPVYQTAD